MARLHLVLQLAIAGTAIGVAKLVKVGPLDHLPARTSSRSPATLATVYLALGLIGGCTRRRPSGGLFVLRLATAGVVVIVGVAAWQLDFVDLVEGVAALSVVAVLYTVRRTGCPNTVCGRPLSAPVRPRSCRRAYPRAGAIGVGVGVGGWRALPRRP